MAKGKTIGNNEERRIAKYLTKWVSGQDKSYIFWRCPSSGAIGSVLEDNGELCGDIIAIKQEGTFLTSKFSIEVKRNYPNSSFNSFMKKNKNDEILSFWQQACNDANKANKHPMLIYTKIRHNSLLGINDSLLIQLPEELQLKRRLTMCVEDGKLPCCVFFDMDDFFSIITPDHIKLLKER